MWRLTPALVTALDERFGPPVDAYVNGSQVWLREDGPGEVTLEWRLHPVPGFRRPEGMATYDVFEMTADALARGVPLPAPLETLWEGLEAFAAYGDEVEPAILASSCTAALGVAPDTWGLVDHAPIADEWERSGRRTSIVEALMAQLDSGAGGA